MHAYVYACVPCVVWCGVVWCGVVWCGVVWCGVVWRGVVWCGVVVVVCVCVCVSVYVNVCKVLFLCAAIHTIHTPNWEHYQDQVGQHHGARHRERFPDSVKSNALKRAQSFTRRAKGA
jgi:hypothetical protein